MTKNELNNQRRRERYKLNKDKINQQRREHYKLTKDKFNQQRRERYSNDNEYRYKIRCQTKNRSKELYHNSLEFRTHESTRHTYYQKAKYVKDGRLDLIENYDKAKADNFKGWDIHHRDEIRLLPSGMIVIRTMEELIENGRYYDCPPNELIWLTHSEHSILHNQCSSLLLRSDEYLRR